MVNIFKNSTILLFLSIYSCTNSEETKIKILSTNENTVKKCCENINSRTNLIINQKNIEQSFTDTIDLESIIPSNLDSMVVIEQGIFSLGIVIKTGL